MMESYREPPPGSPDDSQQSSGTHSNSQHSAEDGTDGDQTNIQLVTGDVPDGSLSQYPLEDDITCGSFSQYPLADDTTLPSTFFEQSERLHPLGEESGPDSNQSGRSSGGPFMQSEQESSVVHQMNDLRRSLESSETQLASSVDHAECKPGEGSASTSMDTDESRNTWHTLRSGQDSSLERPASSDLLPIIDHMPGPVSSAAMAGQPGQFAPMNICYSDDDSFSSPNKSATQPTKNYQSEISTTVTTRNVTMSWNEILGTQDNEKPQQTDVDSQSFSSENITKMSQNIVSSRSETSLSQYSMRDVTSWTEQNITTMTQGEDLPAAQLSYEAEQHIFNKITETKSRSQVPPAETSGLQSLTQLPLDETPPVGNCDIDTTGVYEQRNVFGDTVEYPDHSHSMSLDHSIKFQPQVNRLTFGDSYLEKRPLGSSTPASSRVSDMFVPDAMKVLIHSGEGGYHDEKTSMASTASSRSQGDGARSYIMYPPDLQSSSSDTLAEKDHLPTRASEFGDDVVESAITDSTKHVASNSSLSGKNPEDGGPTLLVVPEDESRITKQENDVPLLKEPGSDMTGLTSQRYGSVLPTELHGKSALVPPRDSSDSQLERKRLALAGYSMDTASLDSAYSTRLSTRHSDTVSAASDYERNTRSSSGAISEPDRRSGSEPDGSEYTEAQRISQVYGSNSSDVKTVSSADLESQENGRESSHQSEVIGRSGESVQLGVTSSRDVLVSAAGSLEHEVAARPSTDVNVERSYESLPLMGAGDASSTELHSAHSFTGAQTNDGFMPLIPDQSVSTDHLTSIDQSKTSQFSFKTLSTTQFSESYDRNLDRSELRDSEDVDLLLGQGDNSSCSSLSTCPYPSAQDSRHSLSSQTSRRIQPEPCSSPAKDKDEHNISQNDSVNRPGSVASSTNTVDTLDRDVRNILRKYGETLTDDEGDVSREGRANIGVRPESGEAAEAETPEGSGNNHAWFAESYVSGESRINGHEEPSSGVASKEVMSISHEERTLDAEVAMLSGQSSDAEDGSGRGPTQNTVSDSVDLGASVSSTGSRLSSKLRALNLSKPPMTLTYLSTNESDTETISEQFRLSNLHNKGHATSQRSHADEDGKVSHNDTLTSVSDGAFESEMEDMLPSTYSGQESKVDDALAQRVRHLLTSLSDNQTAISSGGSRTSSRRSSQSGSINYDQLQQELDTIQQGLQVLQSGELAFTVQSKPAITESTVVSSTAVSSSASLRMADSDPRSETEVELGTPRHYSWDYAADLGIDHEAEGRFMAKKHVKPLLQENKSALPAIASEGSSESDVGRKVEGTESPQDLSTPDSGSVSDEHTLKYSSQDGSSTGEKTLKPETPAPNRDSRMHYMHESTGSNIHPTKSSSSYSSGSGLSGVEVLPSHDRSFTSYGQVASGQFPEQSSLEDSFTRYGAYYTQRFAATDRERQHGVASSLSTSSSHLPHQSYRTPVGSETDHILHQSYRTMTPVGSDQAMGTRTLRSPVRDINYSRQLSAMMARESPSIQAYEYLSEAEVSQRSVHANLDSSLHSIPGTPLPQRPLTAFRNIHSFLTTQLDQRSKADFDRSIELHSPYRRHLEANLGDRALSDKSMLSTSEQTSQRSVYSSVGGRLRSPLEMPADHVGSRTPLEVPSDSSQHAMYSSRFGTPERRKTSPQRPRSTDQELLSRESSRLVDSGTNLQLRPSSSLSGSSSTARPTRPHSEPTPLRLASTSQSAYSLSSSIYPHRRRHVGDLNSSTILGSHSQTDGRTSSTSDHPPQAWAECNKALPSEDSYQLPNQRGSPQGQQDKEKDPLPQSASEPHISQRDRRTPTSHLRPRDSPLGQASSQHTPAARLPSPRISPAESKYKSASPATSEGHNTSPSLQAYRPVGSQEVYYVESETDDAGSTTTLESTHIGSDDAHGPKLPSHCYGSRQEPPGHSLGIYGNKKTLEPQQPSPESLEPITEHASFESTLSQSSVMSGATPALSSSTDQRTPTRSGENPAEKSIDSLYGTPKQRGSTLRSAEMEHSMTEKSYKLGSYDVPIDLSKYAATSKRVLQHPADVAVYTATANKQLSDLDAEYAQSIVDKYLNPMSNTPPSDNLTAQEMEEELRALRMLSRQLLQMKDSGESGKDTYEIKPAWLAASLSLEEQASRSGKSLSPHRARVSPGASKMEFTALEPEMEVDDSVSDKKMAYRSESTPVLAMGKDAKDSSTMYSQMPPERVYSPYRDQTNTAIRPRRTPSPHQVPPDSHRAASKPMESFADNYRHARDHRGSMETVSKEGTSRSPSTEGTWSRRDESRSTSGQDRSSRSPEGADMNLLWERFQQTQRRRDQLHAEKDLHTLVQDPVHHLLHSQPVWDQQPSSRAHSATHDSSQTHWNTSQTNTTSSFSSFEIPVEKPRTTARKYYDGPLTQVDKQARDRRERENQMKRGSDKHALRDERILVQVAGQKEHRRDRYLSDVQGEQRRSRVVDEGAAKSSKSKTPQQASTTKEPAATSSGVTSLKTVLLGGEETLQSIPEDSTLDSVSTEVTTTSESDSAPKYIPKRHMPSDPKLLKLQQKIHRQKEKYLMDRRRELKLRAKVHMLERMLHEKAHEALDENDSQADITISTLASMDITDTSECSGLTSSDGDLTLISDVTSTCSLESTCDHQTPPHVHRCECGHKHAFRDKPTSTPHTKPSTQTNKKNISTPPMKLKEIVYTDDRGAKKTRPIRTTVRESGRKSGPSLKVTRASKSRSPHNGRSPHKSRSPLHKSRSPHHKSRSPHHKSQSPHHKSQSPHKSRSPHHKSRSPHRSHSPAHRKHGDQKENKATTKQRKSVSENRQAKDENGVTMVSEAVQTSFTNLAGSPHNMQNAARGPGADELARNNNPAGERTASYVANAEHEKPKTFAAQSGVSWFVPLEDPRPWRRPLRERQLHALGNEYSTRAGTSFNIYFDERQQPRSMSEDPRDDQENRPSLQETCDRYMRSFIQRSRHRQRSIAMRAEERRIHALHQREHELLYSEEIPEHIRMRMPPSNPRTERLFLAQRRFMSKREMKELTMKKYKRLPEVTEKEKEKKRQSEYQTNRLNAKLYKQRVLNRVLRRRTAWV